MPFDIGINFRASAGFVTDGAGEVWSGSAFVSDQYPVTRGGVVMGWTATASTSPRDRDATIDRRLAGCHFSLSTTNLFRIDLPASGAYAIHLALGDWGSVRPITANLLDSDATTLLKTWGTGANIPGDSFMDATGAVLTNLAWPGSEQPTTVTVSGTSLYFRTNNNSTPIAHLRVVSAAPATSGWSGLAGLCKPGAGVAHIFGG